MNKKELKELTDKQLVRELENAVAEEVKEANFRKGGVTKKAIAQVAMLREELIRRLEGADK